MAAPSDFIVPATAASPPAATLTAAAAAEVASLVERGRGQLAGGDAAGALEDYRHYFELMEQCDCEDGWKTRSANTYASWKPSRYGLYLVCYDVHNGCAALRAAYVCEYEHTIWIRWNR